MVVLKGEFIKLFDNRLCEQFIAYKRDNTEAPPPPELVGTIITDQEEDIVYEFDHPLHPYGSRLYKGIDINNGCNLGLFKINSIENSVFKGIKKPYPGGPYRFTTLSSNTVINTPKIEPGETLMWVDLDKAAVRLPFDRDRSLRHRGVESLSSPLPDDIITQIKEEQFPKKGGKRRTQRRRNNKNKSKRYGSK